MSENAGETHIIVEPETPPAPDIVEPVGDAYREEVQAVHSRLDGHEQRLGELHAQVGELLARPVAEPEVAADVVDDEPEPEHIDEPKSGSRKFGRVRR